MRRYCLYFAIACLLTEITAYAGDCDATSVDISFSHLKTLANGGDADSANELGRRFEYGLCVTKDDVEAIYWYQQAFELGHANASYRLGVLYDNGWGVNENDSKAVAYFQMAAKQNHAFAQYDLAIMYLNGTGVEKNIIFAYKWLFIAVRNGNELMAERLSGISKLMTADQIATAQNLALETINEL